MSFYEFKEAIKKLVLHKDPGINGVSPNTTKALNHDNKKSCLKYVLTILTIRLKLMNGKLVMLKYYKKIDLSNPNNKRGINLLDVVSKVVSIVIISCLQYFLEKFDTPLQFRSCPESGCPKRYFSLRTLLQMRKEHDLES